jgi:hypothetical protein
VYAWIFRHLPGPTVVRILLSVLLTLAAVLLLMEFVFPKISSLGLLEGEATLGG